MSSNSNHLKQTITKTSLKKPSKYRSKKVLMKGRMYDSQKEANHSQMLEIMRKSSLPEMRVVKVDYQYPLEVVVNNKKICKYYCDFVVEFADKRVEYHDVKGFATPVYKLKKKLVEAIYGIKILEK